MKKIKTVLLTICITILFCIAVSAVTSISPVTAIRKHLFQLNPVQSITCDVQPTAIATFGNGWPFIVREFTDKTTGMPVSVVYVKRNVLGLYYCSYEGRELYPR